MPVTVTCSRCGKPITDVVYEIHNMAVTVNGLTPLSRCALYQLHWKCLGAWARNRNR